MNLTQIIERIQQEFPNKQVTEIILEVNKSYRDFASKSEVCVTYTDITSFNTCVDLNTDLDFPIDGKKIKDVNFLDANGAEISSSLRFEITETGQMYFYYGNTVQTSLPTSVEKIRIYYSYVPNKLSLPTDEPDMPTELQDGIIYDVLEKFLQTAPTMMKKFSDGSTMLVKDWDSIKYYNAKYKEKIIDAKKYINSWTTMQSNSKADRY